MSEVKFFKDELMKFENADIRDFTIMLLQNAPDYFWKVSASSTGKYHPAYTIGEMGLAKHVKGATQFMNYFLELEQYQNEFNSRERDCMRCSIMIHDLLKQGDGSSGYTVFDHPLLIAEKVLSYKGEYLSDSELEYIADGCVSHMGQWTTTKRSKVELPKPLKRHQQMVHLADYLASRKSLEVHFDTVIEQQEVTLETITLPFGKHKSEKLVDVNESDHDYLVWLKNNTTLKEPLKSFIDKLVN